MTLKFVMKKNLVLPIPKGKKAKLKLTKINILKYFKELSVMFS